MAKFNSANKVGLADKLNTKYGSKLSEWLYNAENGLLNPINISNSSGINSDVYKDKPIDFSKKNFAKGFEPDDLKKYQSREKFLTEASANPFANPSTSLKGLFLKMRQHPFKTAGLGITGAMNIAGLLDDEHVGGQILGAAVPGLVAGVAGASPYTIAMSALGGGSIGSLFDKLRTKRDEQQAMQEQYLNQMMMDQNNQY